MRLLLDTNVLLWWLNNDARLGAAARRDIQDAADAAVSVASVWEMSLKQAIGKLTMPGDLDRRLREEQFTVVPVHLDHAVRYGQLPLLHRDPFDRMLVAQAQIEQLTIITGDRNIPRYEVATLPAG